MRTAFNKIARTFIQELSHGCGNERFVGIGESSDARANVHRDAIDFIVLAFNFSNVQTGTNREAKSVYR
jgi:hypothetical protein